MPDWGERVDAALLRLEDRQEVRHNLDGQQVHVSEPQQATPHACLPEESCAFLTSATACRC